MIASISINYKKQIVIINIKLSMQCSMCQVLPYKHENLYKKWSKKHISTRWHNLHFKKKRNGLKTMALSI